MITPEQSQKVLNFLQNQLYMVLATADLSGKPEAALVAFAELDNMHLVMATRNRTRKYANIVKNTAVSVVIGFQGATLQCDGTIQELRANAAEMAKQVLVKKHPEVEKFLTQDDHRVFEITSRWLRYFDLSHGSPETFEADLVNFNKSLRKF